MTAEFVAVCLIVASLSNSVSTLALGSRISALSERVSQVESAGRGGRVIAHSHAPADAAYGDSGEVESK